MKILVINGGSSSIKVWFGNLQEPLPAVAPRPEWEAQVEWGRQSGTENPIEALARALEGVRERPEVVGHRIVHGGRAYRDSTRITADVRDAIKRQVEFAPTHNRLELEAIGVVERVLGDVPQVAVFDTSFHRTLQPAAYVYPGPYGWREIGIRRYGFHGISHQYASRRAADMIGRKDLRIIVCHLGNGSSLTAVRNGESVDTTMGFTPLEGLMMGTRSGSVDPGILIYLIRHGGYSADQLECLLNHESGLKGISGVSGDMREVVRALRDGNQRAQLAFDMYVHRVCREAGGMAASLGGVDALVFTAGIGENTPELREAVCGRLAFLGVALDAEKNAAVRSDSDIATEESKARVLVIRAEEDWEIARECYRIVRAGQLLAHAR